MKRFPPARRATIALYERRYGVRFSDEFRAFLLRTNGLLFGFSSDAAREAGVSLALADMNTLFGVGDGDPNVDLLRLTAPHWDFYDVRMLPFAPAIGLGGDFCTFSEISIGPRRGEIMYTDGELFGEFRKRLSTRTTPQGLIEGFVKDGYFMPTAKSFSELIDLYAKMAGDAGQPTRRATSET